MESSVESCSGVGKGKSKIENSGGGEVLKKVWLPTVYKFGDYIEDPLPNVKVTPLMQKILDKEASSDIKDPRLGKASEARRKFNEGGYKYKCTTLNSKRRMVEGLPEENPRKNSLNLEQTGGKKIDNSSLACTGPDSHRSREAANALRKLNWIIDQKTPSEWEKIGQEDRNLRIKHWEENELKLLLKKDCECAENAITFYNQKHGSDYEVVETLQSYSVIINGLWYHCNFKAQSKSAGTDPKLFFAELNHSFTACCILDDHEKIVRGCLFCPELISHPGNEFQVGHQRNGRKARRGYFHTLG